MKITKCKLQMFLRDGQGIKTQNRQLIHWCKEERRGKEASPRKRALS